MKVLITNTVALDTGGAAILRPAALILRRSFAEELDITAYDGKPEPAARATGLDLAFSHLAAEKKGTAARLRPKEMRRSAFVAGEMVREALERAA